MMKTIKSAVESVGGTMEQDGGGRFEVWQCCAPYGLVWVGGSKHIRLEWQPGVKTSKEARKKAISEALECVRCGVRTMTTAERLECEEPEPEPTTIKIEVSPEVRRFNGSVEAAEQYLGFRATDCSLLQLLSRLDFAGSEAGDLVAGRLARELRSAVELIVLDAKAMES
jgi:hypothetical protein